MDVGFESPVVTGLSLDDNQIQVNVLNLPNNHKFVNDIFESASKYNINIDMISIIYHEESIDMSFSVVDENIEEVKNYILQKHIYSLFCKDQIVFHQRLK